MRFAVVLAVLALFLPVSLHAQTLAGIGMGLAVEQEGRQRNYETRLPFLARAGYGFERIDAFFEYATFAAEEGEGVVAVHRRQHSWLGFVRWKLDSASPWVTPFLGAGAGAISESVRTEAAGVTIHTDGEPRLALALATGATAYLNQMFDLSFDLRLTTSDDLNPNPRFGATAALGIQF